MHSDGLFGICESGSNDNGNYIKFSDGTMICTKKITAIKSFVAYESIYESDSFISLGSYAVPFIEEPIVNVTYCGGGTSHNISAWIEIYYAKTKSFAGNLWMWSYAANKDVTMIFDIFAIGRWK